MERLFDKHGKTRFGATRQGGWRFMSFAVAGRRVPGVSSRRPEVVTKSIPDFWEVFQPLYAV